VQGRTVKTEILNWQGGSVYAATVNTYNALDQVVQVREYAGSESSGTYQDTTMTYDGYGRLKTKHVPEQNGVTTWDYNADDTVQKVTDARGASQTFAYSNRHLPTSITYAAPGGAGITVPATATFAYDAAGNRTSMTDDTGTTNYSYDSLSRMTSETRTFTGLTGSYPLNYSYNLANALTVLSIPFRSRQIGYNYDTAGRPSGVTASGFSATYYAWPNQYTQNLTSFASNIAYRASGARKSMTYGNSTSEQTTYNPRLQPSSYTLNNMNYQNTNVCCSYPTYSTMTWNYGYYDDGSLKHAWDSTNEWFDRSYKYDHASRLKEASTFRRARGLSPYPAINYPDPYFQSITYDAFDHSNRIGKLYTGEPSDIGTYGNNRRTGWEYDVDGNVISDSSYQQTIDASGINVRSVSHAKVGDGVQYPLQPRLDITQTYNGDGQPAKRVQVSRVPGVVDEFGQPGEPLENTQTTHYVHSSVLGGATVVELGGGDTIHIYAAGQRIARETLGNVSFEHHNPATGIWVTSHGHSSYRTTAREERDPRGAETPLSNPYAGAENYVDWKFGQPLFIEGSDPFDYVPGYTKDGLPMTRGDLGRILAKLGPAGFLVFDVYRIPKTIFSAGEHERYLSEFYVGSVAIELRELLFNYRPSNNNKTRAQSNPTPGFAATEMRTIKKAINKGSELLKEKHCQKGLNKAGINISEVNRIFATLAARPLSDLSSSGYNIFDAETSTDPMIQQFLQSERGKASGGFIAGQNIMLRNAFFSARGSAKINGEVSRALALIHEVIHLTGKNDSDFGGSAKLNDVVIRACFNENYGHKDLAIVSH